MRDRYGVLTLPLLLAAGALLLFAPAAAQQKAEQLAEGPGGELVRAKCTLCHDLSNITGIRQTREGWDDTIKIMIRRGAPVSPEEEAVILNYLTKHYGR